ncbi:sterol carrier family protein [Actinomyces wuliandei]|uniref:sterol carrier family protein n=1 Tax=Actinomyces wuliandei TaxID=2057743 RepID=UPI000FDA8BAD|nr:sterol carrier family protein [Actinomyces wuliandei]
MPPRRRIDPAAGAQALRQWAAQAQPDAPAGKDTEDIEDTDTVPLQQPRQHRIPERQVTATAVRYTLEELAARAPGRAVEVRVPPFGVTQAVAGTVHRRGTPPSVVETDASTWLALATGTLTWPQALASGALHASGERCDLSPYLPLVRLGGDGTGR